MTRYLVDTNLYIEGLRNEAAAGALRRFTAVHMPALMLSSVVMLELLAGCTTPEKRRQVDRLIIEPFRRRRRVLTPNARVWRSAGNAIAASRRHANPGPSLVNDFLLAASCREYGATLVTRNRRDFEMIRTSIPFRFLDPWPE